MTEARRKAIAMRYRSEQDQAPRLVAKGGGEIADRILALAREHGIPLHEDRDLVTMLEVLDLGVEIPPHLYRAMAEVLAHIYRVNRQQ
ncbi:MAG: EscU/YscU/HrcU family type III secretion system export apparatus switch protein [Planctomycetota bacterium]|jgi:flagellar biosynthesis protein